MPYRAPELFTCDIGSVYDQRVDTWVNLNETTVILRFSPLDAYFMLFVSTDPLLMLLLKEVLFFYEERHI